MRLSPNVAPESGPYYLQPETAYPVAFLSVEAKGIKDRLIVHREEQRFFFLRAVGMFVPAPERHNETVALFPVKGLPVDYRRAAAAKDMINRSAGVAMHLGPLSGAQHLHPA